MIKQKFKNYLKEFIEDESGMELLQWAAIVVASAVLIAIVMKIKDTVQSGLEQSNQKVKDGFGNAGINIP